MTHIQKAVYSLRIFVVQSLSCVQLLAIPRTVASQVPLSSPISQSWLKFMSPESVMLSNHLILCRPFSLRRQFSPAGGSFPVSWIFASGDQSIRASATVLPVTTQGWFPLKIDWFDFLAIQGFLKNLHQHNSTKASILQLSAFFMVQLSHPCSYWKTSFDYLDLCQQSDVFAFQYAVYVCPSFPFMEQASFNFMAAATICSDFGAQEKKICHCFHFFPFCLPWSDGTRCHDLRLFNVEFQARFFTLLFHLYQEALWFLLTFCHLSGIIYISEVVDISPGNLEFSLWFIQPGISLDVLCIEVK